MWIWLEAGIVALIVGLSFVIGGIATFRRQRRERATWSRADGVVVELYEDETGGDYSVFCPVIDFANAKGVTSRFVSDLGSRPAGYEVGDVVPVLYDPNSGSAQIAMNSDWHLARTQLVFGAIFLAIGVLFSWLQFRSPP
jgi:hypothetical protein